jgi:hypothetical protein
VRIFRGDKTLQVDGRVKCNFEVAMTLKTGCFEVIIERDTRLTAANNQCRTLAECKRQCPVFDPL